MVLPQRCGLNTVSFGQYGGVCDYITQFFSTTVSEMCCMWVQYVSKMQDVFFFLFLCNRGSFFFVELCRLVCYFILLVEGKIWDSLCCLSPGLGLVTKDIKYNGKKPRDGNPEAIQHFYYHLLWQQTQQVFGLHSLYPVGVHPDVSYNSAGSCLSFQIHILTLSGSIVCTLFFSFESTTGLVLLFLSVRM